MSLHDGVVSEISVRTDSEGDQQVWIFCRVSFHIGLISKGFICPHSGIVISSSGNLCCIYFKACNVQHCTFMIKFPECTYFHVNLCTVGGDNKHYHSDVGSIGSVHLQILCVPSFLVTRQKTESPSK